VLPTGGRAQSQFNPDRQSNVIANFPNLSENSEKFWLISPAFDGEIILLINHVLSFDALQAATSGGGEASRRLHRRRISGGPGQRIISQV
jgi:hypothetical protein